MFKVKEMILMSHYDGDFQSRKALIGALERALPHIRDSAENAVYQSTIGKLQSMTDEQFSNLDFSESGYPASMYI